MDQKLENLLNISLEILPQEREKSPDLGVGYNPELKTWELIVYYVGNINIILEKYNEIQVVHLLNQYAIIITPERYIEELAREPAIIYIEKPKLIDFEMINGLTQSCIRSVQTNIVPESRLLGEGTIVAVIDTGIDPTNIEFRNDDGTTRILEIWDQTNNIIFNREQINQALINEDYNSIPGIDIVGHGTNVATIACGRNGVANKSDIIVVKMGLALPYSFPRTTQLMRAVDFVMRKAVAYNKPVAINISFGNNYGDHTGSSLIETYLDSISENWKCSIFVGSGNEGLGATHIGGNIENFSKKDIELYISSNEDSVSLQVWKNYWDEIDIEIITPSGKNIGKITQLNRVQRISVDETTLLLLYGQPAPFSMKQEIYIGFLPRFDYIREGIWVIRLISKKVVTGKYDIWLPAIGTLNMGTGFASPDSKMSITIPATAQKVISVGAYNARTGIVAPFSGRGYVSGNEGPIIVKPELVAPGVDIVIRPGRIATGTSFATPFVTGSAALLMEWGIVKGNDPYLYGDKLKPFLISGAKKLPAYTQYPNPQVGLGALCFKDSLPV